MSRLKLGIIFNFSPDWMGGIIYILNIIKILDFLDDKEKPEIFLFYKPDLKKSIDEIKYPYLKLIEWNFPTIAYGHIKSQFLRRNAFIDKIICDYPLDAVYPLQDFPVRTNTRARLISWNADFQHKYYPEFFSKIQIAGRNLRTYLALRHNDNFVLSSKAAYNDLNRFFKIPENINIHIYHFVSVIDKMVDDSFEKLIKKYNLPQKYFLVSNQFHKHKNHKVLLNALSLLKNAGIKKHLVMTGRFPSATDSPYLNELHDIIDENKLHDQLSLLGVISRNDQLLLMRHSEAVLQPSLFEGWSTVIEDAKSLQVPVVASNLDVNIEQLGETGVFFNPLNPNELAAILKDFPERNLDDVFYEDYFQRVRKAALILLSIFRNSKGE